MQRYGTVMIGKLAVPVEDVDKLAREWMDERTVPGFQHEDLMVCDDGETFVMAVFFESKAAYEALADDPEQDRWYTEKLAPMLAGEPQWLDGHWLRSMDLPG